MYIIRGTLDEIEIKRLWEKREQLEEEVAQDFSYWLWNFGNLQENPAPKEIILNFGIAIGRLMEIDSELNRLNPQLYKHRTLVEIKASLYSRLP